MFLLQMGTCSNSSAPLKNAVSFFLLEQTLRSALHFIWGNITAWYSNIPSAETSLWPDRKPLTVVPSRVLKPSPGWTKKDFSVSGWKEIKRKSLPQSLHFFYCLKFACNHPWMFHVSGDFVSSALDIHNIDNSVSHLGSSSSLWKNMEIRRWF